MSGIDLSQFHQVFFEESFEWLETMEAELVEMDPQSVDAETINTIFRAAHSIKGGSGTFGFTQVSEFTHVLETLLDDIRDGKRSLDQQKVDLFLASVDCLRDMLTALQDNQEPDTEVSSSLKASFEAMMAQDDAAPAAHPETESVPDAAAESEAAPGNGHWSVIFVPGADIIRTGNEPFRIIRELAGLAEVVITPQVDKVPQFSELDPEQCYLSWHFEVPLSVEKAQIEEVFEWVIDDSELSIEQVSATTQVEDAPQPIANAENEEPAVEAETEVDVQTAQVPAVAPAAKSESKPAAKKSSGGGESQSIRVGIDKVDSLINLVGELVITQSMLGQLGQNFDPAKLTKLQEGLAQLEHNTRDLQESVMRIRMLPISFTFSRFPRLVRDLSQKLGKKIELKLLGEQTELDKTVMEKIGDPLVHMVRNSLDHGLEMPQERLDAGKGETGTITLNAFHQGGNIVIEIKDDGRGINCDKVLSKAIEKGLVSESDNLSKEQIQELIFHPGFSTADQISDVSGRGVGMDVVKKNIQALNGTIELTSEQGVGSTFTIRLPLTLAILDGQLIRVGEEIFIVPLVSIVESIQVENALVNNVAGGMEVYRLRNEYVPIIRLYDIFGIHSDAKELKDGLLVVVEGENRKIGLFVDDLEAQQQVVIKSLETNYRRIEGVSGATILGDGTVALIVDIPGLIKIASEKLDGQDLRHMHVA